jgi:16S rRNA processing protein RimM
MTSRRRITAARRKEKQNQKKGKSPSFDQAGAQQVAPPAFLLVGKLNRPHGVRGEMIMTLMTDFPERLKSGVQVFLGVEHQPVTIKSVRHHNRGLLVSLEGYDNREEVGHLRNREVFVSAEDRPPLPEGEFYLHQILGLQVVSDAGQPMGVVSDWIETGANGVWVVRDEAGAEILLPDIDEVVLNIDLDAGQMTVHLLEGLI